MPRRPSRPGIRQKTADKRIGSTASDRIFRGKVGGAGGSDPTAVHAGDTAGGDLQGTYPNPVITALVAGSTLAALRSITEAANQIPLFTGPGAATAIDTSAFGRAWLDVADAAAGRSALGLVGAPKAYVERALPAPVGDYVELGHIDHTVFAQMAALHVAIVCGEGGIVITKQYLITGFYGAGFDIADGYYKVIPLTQQLAGTDFDLCIGFASGVSTSLRVRKTAGATTPPLAATITPLGQDADIFTATSGTGSMAAPGLLPTTTVEQSGGLTKLYGGVDLRGAKAQNAADAAAATDLTTKQQLDAKVSDGESAALAGTTGTPSDANRYITEEGPRADLPMNSHKVQELTPGVTTDEGVNVGQFIDGVDFARSGFMLKRPAFAVSIAALPAHTRSGNTLTASANGTLSSAFGAIAASFAANAYQSQFPGVANMVGIAVDGSGNLYIAQPNFVRKYTSAGVLIGSATGGSAPLNFKSVAVDGSGNVFATDQAGNLRKYNSGGVVQWATAGAGTGGIAIDGSGNLYVADPVNHVIHKYNSSGVLQTTIGSAGSGDGQFNSPTDVKVDGSGNFYVADYGNNRIQKFDSAFAYTSQWGSVGSGNAQFNGPISIAIDGSNVEVVDFNNTRIVKYTNVGVYVSQSGSAGSGNGQFILPYGAVVSGGSLFVVDSGNNRVQKLSTTFPTANPPIDLLVRHEGSGTHLENGLYTLDDPGSAGTPWVMTRRDDADESTELGFGALVQVINEDNRKGGWFYLSTAVASVDLNVTALTWTRKQGGGVDYGLVTALPTGVSPGDRCTLTDSLTTPTWAWDAVYTGEATLPWRVTGGTTLLSSVDTAQTRNVNSYADLTTVGPSIVTPAGITMDLDVQVGAEISGLAAQDGRMSPAIGATAAIDADEARAVTSAANQGSTVVGPLRRKTGVAGGTSIVAKYKAATATAIFANRWMTVKPVRLG